MEGKVLPFGVLSEEHKFPSIRFCIWHNAPVHEVETFTKLATNMKWKSEAELGKTYMSSTMNFCLA